MNAVKMISDTGERGPGVSKAVKQLPRSASRISRCGEDAAEYKTAVEELDRLQRQYRILENQRKTNYEKSQFALLKQRKEIETLEKEKSELQLNVKLAETERSKLRAKYEQQTSQLLERQKKFLETIDSEKARCKLLDQQIVQTETELKEQRKILQKDEVESSNQRKIDNLEKRIAFATVQYNKLLGKNSALRGEIDALLKERERYHAIYRTLSKSLLRGKKEMLQLIEQAKAAYDQREEMQMKLQAVRRRDDSEQEQLTNEIRNLRRTVEHDEKLQEFLAEKWKDRIEGNAKDRDVVGTDEQSPVTLPQMSDKYLTALREVFEGLKREHGEEDLQTLVESFIQREEENYGLFTYVHDVTQDCERLQKGIDESQRKIGQLKDADKKRSLGYRHKLDELRKRLDEEEGESSKMESAAESRAESLRKLKDEVVRLLELSEVPEEELRAITDQDGEGLDEETALKLMDLLEKRSADLVFAYTQLPAEQKEEESGSAKQEEDKKAFRGDLLSGAGVSGSEDRQRSSRQA